MAERAVDLSQVFKCNASDFKALTRGSLSLVSAITSRHGLSCFLTLLSSFGWHDKIKEEFVQLTCLSSSQMELSSSSILKTYSIATLSRSDAQER